MTLIGRSADKNLAGRLWGEVIRSWVPGCIVKIFGWQSRLDSGIRNRVSQEGTYRESTGTVGFEIRLYEDICLIPLEGARKGMVRRCARSTRPRKAISN